ncbi:dienelactone hydrolase family protein [Massilia sp. GCM10020059]|uniref:Dienelactone hydrolase family protein n=1 Tax=Massilia agrisoli TaxID=2892444 RepID=A0ABS8IP80_9BURK|nr:dienelactone hydrolase family protein [Massilia agrisoli]MCC6069648.1 dienelactone hydrolase family protein [Massilia agrisoli]
MNQRTQGQAAALATRGIGFAAATLPVSAHTVIATDDAGLCTGWHDIVVDGQAVPVFFAQPENAPNLPVLLLISEIFGVHEHIADVARRFARQGYFAIAPDLFVRQGDPTSVPDIPSLMKGIIARTPDAQVMADLDACVAWAASSGGNIERLSVTGWCWGGRIAWLYAAHNPCVKAGVAWYGRLVGESSAIRPQHPVNIARTLKVPVLGLYGAKDRTIALSTVEAMEGELALGSSKSEFVVYPAAGHAFYADNRPSYVEADARDGFKRSLEWLDANGAA